MTFYERAVEWSSWCWPLLVNHLWQATLFSLLIIIVYVPLKGAPARVRHSLLLIALIKFALPAAAVASLISRAGFDIASIFAAEGGSQSSGLAISPLLSPVASPPVILQAIETAPPAATAQTTSIAYMLVVQESDYLFVALTLCWTIGCTLLLYSWLRRRSQLSAAINAGKILTSGREIEILERVRSWLGLRRKVTLVVSSKITEPGVWRVFRPIVVLPGGVPELLNDDELEAVMLHEMVHVECWDNLVGILQRIVCCVLWFHPLVWLLDRWLVAEREQSCDDAVIRLSGASEIYAASITKVCRYSIGWQMSGLSSAVGSNLKRRIKRIVAADVKRSPSLAHRIIVCAMGVAVVLFSAAAGLMHARSIAAAPASNDTAAIVDPRFELTTYSFEVQENQSHVAVVNPSQPALQEEARSSSEQIINLPGVQVEVKSPPTEAQASDLNNNSSANQPAADIQPPQAEQEAQKQVPSAAIIPASVTTRSDMRKFIGRYEVDPSRAENFVLDITLENGELWLKPSHADKRKLLQTSETSFTDVYSDFRVTFIQGDKGRIIGMRLDSWGSDNVTARRLMLPQPSRHGNTTFRLKGYPNARIVALAGSFNNWNQSQLLFAREGDEWVCRVSLPPGKHQYKFIIDGNWITDPGNGTIVNDGRGNMNSLLTAE
jgi:beta-lactamase regulating signal transducer with metallopeptidase domain